MTLLMDITRDVCPMTNMKVQMALAKLTAGGRMEVLLKQEAVKNLVSALKADGHLIAVAGRRGDSFVLLVEKGSGSPGGPGTRGTPRPGGEAVTFPIRPADFPSGK